MKYLTLKLSTTTKLKNAIHNAKKVLTQQQKIILKLLKEVNMKKACERKGNKYCTVFFVVVVVAK